MVLNEAGQPKGRRSKDKAYIVMIGMTGAGKSSTLNALFDRNASDSENLDKNDQVSFKSCTQDIIEYTVNVPSKDSTEQELIVIDTPGFHDTWENDFAEKDSRIMATLEQYLKTHAGLKDIYPTAVLLVVDFQDEQINKEESFFVDFLKALEKLIDNYTLVDTGAQTCNLILVLTHFMDGRPELQKHPEQQVCILRGLVRAFTSIPPNFPVVLAENLGKAFKLNQSNGYYEIPNGELYPHNLFKAIETVAIKSEDEAGIKIISGAFSNPLSLKKRENAVIPLLDFENRHCLKYYYENEISSFKENEITRIMDKIWATLPSENTQGYGIFLRIAKAAFAKNGINSPENLPKTPKEIVDLLQQLPEHYSLDLVLRQLGVDAPTYWTCVEKVGSFYNICNDTTTDICPFLYDKTRITGIGYQFPTYLDAHLVSNKQDKRFQQVVWYPTKEAYVSKRLRSLNINFDSGKENSFNALPIAGCNFRFEKPVNEITGILELRKYSISLRSDAELKPEYITELTTLPQTYLNWSKAIIAWQKHFSKYGSHVVQEAFLGGYVRMSAKSLRKAEKYAEITEVIQALDSMLSKIGLSQKPTDLKKLEGWTVEMQYYGGELDVYRPPIDQVFSKEGLKSFSRWAYSLKHQPTLLTSQLPLEHICKFVKMKNVELSETLSSAANINMGCSVYENSAKQRSAYSWCTVM